MALLSMEQQQLTWFRDSFEPGATALLPESDELESILHVVLNEKAWIDNSGKGDPPPDFLCPSEHLMMEVTRIDDHAHPGRKPGKLVNPYKAEESRMRQELEENGVLESCPNVRELYLAPDTGLPSKEDHNYDFYLGEFRRVVGKHASQAASYRQNHPGNKLVLLIFDESTAYCRIAADNSGFNDIVPGQVLRGWPHWFWMDRAFLKVVYSSGADYVIWCAPWKYARDGNGDIIPFPKACLFDLSCRVVPEQDYPSNQMMSLEA